MVQRVRPRVLVVDDDASIRHLLVDVLSDEGFATTAAADGRQALEFMAGAGFALILLDLSMPVMDGRTCYRKMRTNGAPDIPVIIISAVGAHRARRELGAEAALEKPFDLDDLVAVVRRFAQP